MLVLALVPAPSHFTPFGDNFIIAAVVGVAGIFLLLVGCQQMAINVHLAGAPRISKSVTFSNCRSWRWPGTGWGRRGGIVADGEWG